VKKEVLEEDQQTENKKEEVLEETKPPLPDEQVQDMIFFINAQAQQRQPSNSNPLLTQPFNQTQTSIQTQQPSSSNANTYACDKHTRNREKCPRTCIFYTI
jgi:hypothetical protein